MTGVKKRYSACNQALCLLDIIAKMEKEIHQRPWKGTRMPPIDYIFLEDT